MTLEKLESLNETQRLILNGLPDAFTSKEFVDYCKSTNIPLRTSYRWLNHFFNIGLIIKTQSKEFIKNYGNSKPVVRTGSTNIIDKVSSSNINEDTGTGTIEGTLADQPLSANDIIEKFKIDTTKWRLVQYWNKEKSGGGYFVSANIARIKEGDLTTNTIAETIEKVFGNLSVTPLIIPDVVHNEKALFIYTSDKHIGAYVSDKAIYENNYNAATFNERMQELLNEILYMVDVFGAFEDIYVLDLGDSLDGQNSQTTRGGHSLPQNMSDKEAFETYLSVHRQFFDDLFSSKSAASYHVYSVTEDNHSGDFGYFATRALEIYLNTRYPGVTTKVFEKFMQHFTYGDHTFIITHGKDSEDMKHGFPLVLNDKVENFINKYIKYHKINSPHVHLIKGDLHQEASQVTADFRYRNVLSMFGSSKWMMNNFSASSKGGTSMEVVEKNTHRIFPHKILYT